MSVATCCVSGIGLLCEHLLSEYLLCDYLMSARLSRILLLLILLAGVLGTPDEEGLQLWA